MANTDAPFGAVAIGTTDGSDYHGKMREVEFVTGDAVACFLGDFVKLTGTTGTDGKTPVVAQAAAGEACIGAVQSFIPNFADEGTLSSTPNHRAASTSRKAMVPFGSDVLYAIQEDGDTTPLTAGDAGRNVDIIVGSGSTVTGVSGMEINSDSVVDATAQLRLHHLRRDIDTQLGTVANGVNAQWVVTINENQDDHGAGVA